MLRRGVMTNTVWAPVRPATLWMRVVSMASARVMAGRMVVSRRASIDLPAPGGPNIRMLWTQFLHRLDLHVHVSVWWLIMRPGRERHQPPSLQALEGQAT
jgi:hypothetical protein